MIYSKDCDNPNTMVILDPTTNKTYTQQEAEQLPKEIRSRLINHCILKGYNVMDLDEINKNAWWNK